MELGFVVWSSFDIFRSNSTSNLSLRTQSIKTNRMQAGIL
jgi:hypothetical protein